MAGVAGRQLDCWRLAAGDHVNVITELRVIAQSEWDDHPPKVREVCAEAAERLSYQQAQLAATARHEKQLRDELDRMRGLLDEHQTT